MKCINKILSAGLILLAACVFLCGCGTDRSDLKEAYKIYDTSDAYRLTDSPVSKPVTLFAEDLCVGGTSNTKTDAFDAGLAKSEAVFSLDDKTVTYAKNIYAKRYPASTTKILTAYIALKYGNMDDIMTVSGDAINSLMAGSSVCGLKPGDKISLKDALYGLLLCSGNDAANVIAEHISGSRNKFAKLMNKEAAALGATHSHFVNAHGLHDKNHYTTAYDMYLIFNEAIKNEDFLHYVSTKKQQVTYEDSNGNPVKQNWENTNGFLSEEYEIPENVSVVGGKTGTTGEAGYCLVLLSRNKEEKPIISIVFKSETRDNLYKLMGDMLTNFSN